ncbi:MAG: SIR2 family protein [Candidatus Methylacidiphilales bacterium]|nr:SIR2 family protein [Candidatus Methylacidiphilales bacterium]
MKTKYARYDALHNDHNVYICGAGFSVPGGIPTVKDFFNKMRDAYDWLVEKERFPEADAIKDVISFRIHSSAAGYWTKLDLENIEELFSLAAASSKPDLLKKIPIAISATISYSRIINTSNSRSIGSRTTASNLAAFPYFEKVPLIGMPDVELSISSYGHHVGKLLGVFQDGTIKGENTFITFNYDTLIEEGLTDIKVPFTYSFANKTTNNEIKVHDYRADSKVKVLKLHGSMNWAKKIGGKGRRFTLYDDYDIVREKGFIPSIVPPTWQKDLSGPLTSIWGKAVEAIGCATRLIIIGFSIPKTDTHFKYLISAGLRSNASLRSIHIVDPDSSEDYQNRLYEIIPNDFEKRGILKFHKQHFQRFTTYDSGPNVFDVGRPWNRDVFQRWS